RIKLPSHTDVSGELRRDEPLILNEGEELPGAVVGEEGSQVATSLSGNIHQEAGEIVCEASFGRGGTGVKRGLAIVEHIETARAKGLFLEQGVTDTAEIGAEFDGVVAHDFRPSVAEIDVRLGANPRETCRVAKQRVGEAAVDLNAD